MTTPHLTLLIPARNESPGLDATVRALEGGVTVPHEILIVDDHSTDGTADVAHRLAAEFPRIRVVPNGGPPGFGRAVRAGLAAVHDGWVVPVMADFCDDPATINAMAAAASGGADVVVGCRNMPGGGREGGPAFKGLGSRAVSWMLHALGGLPTRDATNAFKLYRTSLLHEIRPQEDGFAISVEMLVRIRAHRAHLVDVPTLWRGRSAGESKFRPTRLWWRYMRWVLRSIADRFR